MKPSVQIEAAAFLEARRAELDMLVAAGMEQHTADYVYRTIKNSMEYTARLYEGSVGGVIDEFLEAMKTKPAKPVLTVIRGGQEWRA